MKFRYTAVVAFFILASLNPAHAKHHRQHHHRYYDAGTVIGGRPAGCPHQFCGCGASLRVFGKIIPSLNLASNWYRFPRAFSPASGMVAVRPHHVFVLERPGSQPGVWLVRDSNSGNHLTRLHERSISGYTIVNPNG
jgi:hypothetical protein